MSGKAGKGWDLSADAKTTSAGGGRGQLEVSQEVQNFIRDDLEQKGGEAISYPAKKLLDKLGYKGGASISTVTWSINKSLSRGDPPNGLKCGYHDSGKSVKFYKWDWKKNPMKKKAGQ